MRGKKLIHDFDDFQAVVAKYGKPVPMEISDFHNYQNGVSSGAFTHKPLLSNVQEVMFERVSTKIHWKTSIGDEAYQEGDFLKKKVAMSCMKVVTSVKRRRRISCRNCAHSCPKIEGSSGWTYLWMLRRGILSMTSHER